VSVGTTPWSPWWEKRQGEWNGKEKKKIDVTDGGPGAKNLFSDPRIPGHGS
jgi:hypothetical protein